MRSGDPADRLGALPLLQSVPRQELEWLVERGEVRAYRRGDLIGTADVPVEEMSIILDGAVGLYVPRGAAWRRIMVIESGFVYGCAPYSRIKTLPGKVVAEDESSVHILHERHLPDLIHECPAVTTALVHHVIDRSRDYYAVQLHDDRLLALGRIASGLAHELNNPASGASSAARSLASTLDGAERAFRALVASHLGQARLAAVDAVLALSRSAGRERTPMEATDREDEFVAWAQRRGVDAEVDALAASDVSLSAMDALADALPPEALGMVVGWLGSASAARAVAHDIQRATARVYELVRAVKGFTFMDREGVLADVDVAEGLAYTAALLESKRGAKTAHLRIEAADDLPRIQGYGSEINQVWETLIDNALDAVTAEGTVTVTASAHVDSVVVQVVDDGHGILEENRGRIFDPFFTTKPVGEGAGLGLHQARRIVHLHRGDIDFTSQPGRTEFRVRLPVEGATAPRADFRPTAPGP